MTYLGSKYIDDYRWTTVGTRTAKNRGQKLGHLTKMCNFHFHFTLFGKHYIDLYKTITTLVSNITS